MTNKETKSTNVGTEDSSGSYSGGAAKELDKLRNICYGLAVASYNSDPETLVTLANDTVAALEHLIEQREAEARVSEIDWVHKHTELTETADNKPVFIIRGVVLDKRVAQIRKALSTDTATGVGSSSAAAEDKP